MLQEQNKLIMILYIFNIKLCYGTYKDYDNTPTLKKVIEFLAKKTGFFGLAILHRLKSSLTTANVNNDWRFLSPCESC